MNPPQRRVHGPRATCYRWAGLDLLAVENERLRLVIWPEHGADLLELRHKPTDIDVLWKNPYDWPPRRQPLAQPQRGRSEMYDLFHGGWFVSAPNGFFPADYFGAPLGCHGELQSIPWSVEILEDSAERVRVRLTGEAARTPWVLTRELVLEAGAAVVRWRERLHNRSQQRLPVAWQHHPAFGGPFIEDAEIVTSARTLLTPPADRPELAQIRPAYRGAWPQAPEQSGGVRDCSRVLPSGCGLEHVVHLTDFPQGWAGLWNPRLKLGCGLRWDETVFPYAWSWAVGHGDGGYPLWGSGHTVTLQPSTSPMRPFPDLVAANAVKWVDGRGAIETAMAVGFTSTRDEVLELDR
jgi:hypothetical protein